MHSFRCAHFIVNEYEGTEEADGDDEAEFFGCESVKSRHYKYTIEQRRANIACAVGTPPDTFVAPLKSGSMHTLGTVPPVRTACGWCVSGGGDARRRTMVI